MALSFTRYVDITSGVGAGAAVANRELIGRIFTDNILLPPGSFIEFTTIEQVGNYFGTDSVEYARAAFYFAWISKNIRNPNKISFARWVDTAVAPMIFGAPLATDVTLTFLKTITTGAFSLTLGGDTQVISGLNFSSANSLADVATAIQTAIRAETGTQWTAATVVYNSLDNSFDFVGGSAVAANVIVAAPGTGTDISNDLGWLSTQGAIWAYGSLVETITDTLTASASASNNFGSFVFLPTLDLDEITEAAIWNDGQNVLYQYCIPVTSSNYVATSAAILGYGGCGMTLAPLATEFPEQVPMMILAATDYNAVNSVQNYMYQVFPLTPSVSDDGIADALDIARVNYYGVTQQAGRLLSFYQRGYLTGQQTDPLDMNTYANEQWLKDAAGVAIMTLLLDLLKISANAQGIAQILTILQSVIDLALRNGTISVNKLLTQAQKLYIGQISGDPAAWRQVQSSGYWITAQVQQVVINNATEYQIVYLLIYSKDDIVRKVIGTHVLI